ncbi:MAG TPA: EamA family transporter [Clostridia bacterium]|nr:EamA family transporter [Clostridia bacterium]
MWFWLSLVAILFWSGSDLFSKMGSQPKDKFSHWKMVMAVGATMGIHAVVMLLLGAEFSLRDVITYLPASVLYILSMVLGYVGLRYIELSLSTPICNSSGAVAAVLCFVFLKETMSVLQFFAVGIVTISIFSLSAIEKRKNNRILRTHGVLPDSKYTKSLIAILFPILYCLIDGAGTFVDALLLDGHIKEEAANIAYEFTFFFMAVAAFVYVVVIKKQKIILSKEKPKMIAALCETAGQFAYIYALGDNAIVAAPLISSYCIFSLVWARFILKEKLTKGQYAVIAAAFVGIIILGME